MPQTTSLFDETDLTNWLHKPVGAEDASTIEEVVWGWLQPLMAVLARPDPPAAWLRSAAIELGGIAHENPEGLAQYQLEVEKTVYSEERRKAILELVANGGVAVTGRPASPTGSFPPADRYPDPVHLPLANRYQW